MILALILVLCFITIYLVLLFNREYLGIAYSYQKVSLMQENSVRPKNGFNPQDFFSMLGKSFAILIPAKFFKKLELSHLYLHRDKLELYQTIGQAFAIFIVMLLLYSFTHNPLFFVMAIFFPVGLFVELPIAVSQHKNSIDNSIPHIVACLKVLVVNTETPLTNALEVIIQGLPQYMQPSKLELLRLLQKAEKTNLRETLVEWQTQSSQFKDFLSLLISIYEGASKSAIKTAMENFLAKSNEEEQEKLRNKAENLQLYLVGPVIVMLLVIMQPMVSAIFYMMNTGVN